MSAKPKRKHARPITAWVTPQQEALLAERALELDIDRSTLLRAGLWLCVLQPAIASYFLDIEKTPSAPPPPPTIMQLLNANPARRQADRPTATFTADAALCKSFVQDLPLR